MQRTITGIRVADKVANVGQSTYNIATGQGSISDAGAFLPFVPPPVGKPSSVLRVAEAPKAASTTRAGVTRTNASDWRKLRDLWDHIGYDGILSEANRERIAKGRTPRVDDDWIKHFPGDEALRGEKIPIASGTKWPCLRPSVYVKLLSCPRSI